MTYKPTISDSAKQSIERYLNDRRDPDEIKYRVEDDTDNPAIDILVDGEWIFAGWAADILADIAREAEDK